MDNGGGLGGHVGGLGGHGGGLGGHGGGLGSHDGGSSHGIGGHSSSCDIVGGGAGGQPPNFSSSLSMTKLRHSSALIIIAVTSSIAVFFLSLLIYQLHSESSRLGLSPSRTTVCGDGRDLLRLVPGLNSEHPSTQLQNPEELEGSELKSVQDSNLILQKEEDFLAEEQKTILEQLNKLQELKLIQDAQEKSLIESSISGSRVESSIPGSVFEAAGHTTLEPEPRILPMDAQDGYVQREFSMRENSLLQSEFKPGFYTENECDDELITKTIVTAMQNSSVFHANSIILQASDAFKGQPECKARLHRTSQIVSKVIDRLGMRCRKKSRIVKVYHHAKHPTQASLHSGSSSSSVGYSGSGSVRSSGGSVQHMDINSDGDSRRESTSQATRHLVESILGEHTRPRDSLRLSNERFASHVYEKLESGLEPVNLDKKLTIHVTVFTRSNSEDFSLETEEPLYPQQWMWKQETELALGRKRIVLVLISTGRPDVDRLDCLQHAAATTRVDSLCVSSQSKCVRTGREKSEYIFAKCRGVNPHQFGVLVICWGCDVWHRWTHGFPVLHVQSSQVWNNVVWASLPP